MLSDDGSKGAKLAVAKEKESESGAKAWTPLRTKES